MSAVEGARLPVLHGVSETACTVHAAGKQAEAGLHVSLGGAEQKAIQTAGGSHARQPMEQQRAQEGPLT